MIYESFTVIKYMGNALKQLQQLLTTGSSINYDFIPLDSASPLHIIKQVAD